MSRPRLLLLLLCAVLVLATGASAETWNEIRSTHFAVNTDTGAERGRQVTLHFEQMRAVFGQLILKENVNISTPLTIIAFRNAQEMRPYAPLYQGKPVDLEGFFVKGEDRNYIVLDLSGSNNWESVFHEYAHMLLSGNYPPTQLWFDEGFADYYSTIDVLRDKVEIGKPPQGYLDVLRRAKWIPLADLFQVEPDSKTYNLGEQRSLFYAESWAVVHYLFDTQKLPQAGAYFGLVKNEHVPVEEAVQRAFAMSSQQLQHAVQAYLSSPQAVYRSVSLPLSLDKMNTYASNKLPPLDAQVMLADLQVHMADHQKQGLAALQAIVQQRPENALAQRDLGYAYLQDDDLDRASDCFAEAAKLNSNDPWVHYYSALLRHRSGETLTPEELEESKRDLRDAIRLSPQFADAYNLLGVAEIQSGDLQLAVRDLTQAVQLSPRNEMYRANLAHAYLFAHKFEDATAILQQLAASKDTKVAEQANKDLQEMDEMRARQRIEILGRPANDYTAPQWRPKKTQPQPGGTSRLPEKPLLPQTGPIHYLKGTLLDVDCSGAPAATLTVRSGATTWKMLTADYKRLAVIGADQFSCGWHDVKVAINYRAVEPGTGALVSLELQ